MEKTDEFYMTELQKGQLNAMTVLFDRYNLRMYNFFLKLRLSEAESQDLTQQLFVRALQYRNSFNPVSGSFKTWLYRMALNIQTDYKKSQARYLVHAMPLSDAHLGISNNTDPDFEETDFTRLDHALQLLEPQQKQLIVLSKYQGLKYEEIASITGLSVANVKVKIHRTVLSLRRIYFEKLKTDL